MFITSHIVNTANMLLLSYAVKLCHKIYNLVVYSYLLSKNECKINYHCTVISLRLLLLVLFHFKPS